MTRHVGDVIARGTRSAVHAYGRGAVIKIPAAATPGDWILREAEYSRAVCDAGAPVPRLIGVEEHAGRPASVWERVAGLSMWDCARQRPDRCAEYGILLADLQIALFALVAPIDLPRQRDRLAAKLRRAAALGDAPLQKPPMTLPETAGVSRLCHGDLHPGNVLLTDDGPVVVDWFDASRGDPVADVARSGLLMALTPDGRAPGHLPGATEVTLGTLARAHLARVRTRMTLGDELLGRWTRIEAEARRAEGVVSGGVPGLRGRRDGPCGVGRD